MSSAIFCSLSSPFIFYIDSFLFLDWRRTVSSKFFGIQVPTISIKELVLPLHACCVVSCLRCNKHSILLSSYVSRIGRIENATCSVFGHSSQDTSHLFLHCPATDSFCCSLFGDPLFLYNFWSRPGEFLGFWGFMIICDAPIFWKGPGNQQQQYRDYTKYKTELLLLQQLHFPHCRCWFLCLLFLIK